MAKCGYTRRFLATRLTTSLTHESRCSSVIQYLIVHLYTAVPMAAWRFRFLFPYCLFIVPPDKFHLIKIYIRWSTKCVNILIARGRISLMPSSDVCTTLYIWIQYNPHKQLTVLYYIEHYLYTSARLSSCKRNTALIYLYLSIESNLSGICRALH